MTKIAALAALLLTGTVLTGPTENTKLPAERMAQIDAMLATAD